MNRPSSPIRVAIANDGPQLLRLWGLLFDEDGVAADEPWRNHAQEWFARYVGDSSTARFPVVDVGGEILATAIGTLELGVPNPMCPQGRTVRLANVFTLPEHRGYGYGTLLVSDVIEWARSIDADRVDLSSTEEGQRLYDKAGFVLTSAPRMKLVL
jgi:GNAT superfamily N-acetyltransferase